MPDQPAKRSPSSPRLSVEDADRLADGFTAIWEHDDGPDAGSMAEALPAAATTPRMPLTASPSATPSTRPLMSPAPVGTRPAFSRPQAPPSTSHTAPSGGAAPELFEDRTLPGIAPGTRPSSPLNTLEPAPASESMAALAPASQAGGGGAVQGAANVPGYAVAYTPKDGPLTPAVVIAPEAQSSPEASKRPLAATQPSLARITPKLALPRDPVAQMHGLSAASDALEITDVRGNRGATRRIAIGAAVVLVVLGGALSIGLLGGAPPAKKVESASGATPLAAPTPAAYTTPSIRPASSKTDVSATGQPPESEGGAPVNASNKAAAVDKAPLSAPHNAPAKSAKKPAPPTPARPSTRSTAPETKHAEPEPEPAKSAPTKGDIVRDAPF